MRRLFLSVLVAGGLAFLAACSGQGGYGFSTGSTTNPSIDRIAFQNGSGGYLGSFFVTPIGANTVQVVATGLKGPQSVQVPDATFVWSWAFAGPPTTYNELAANQQVRLVDEWDAANPPRPGEHPRLRVATRLAWCLETLERRARGEGGFP